MSNSQSKVSSGPPIWLWLILVPVTLAVIGGVIVSFVPPDLEKAYAEASDMLSDPNREKDFEKKLRMLEADPAYSDHVNMLRGRVALAQNRAPMALKFFGNVSEGSSLESEAAQRMGDAHRQGGDFDAAVTAYRAALEKDTGDGLSARMNLASLYFMAGGVQLAMDQLNKNIEVDPEFEPSRILRARVRVFLDEYELAREDFEAVLDSPGKFSSTAPDFVDEYFKCLVQLDDVEKLKEVAKDHLGTVASPATRSSVLIKLGEYRDAMVVLQSMEGEAGETSAIKQAKLELLVSEGNVDEAKLLAQQMVTSSPRSLSVMKLAAKAFEASGETGMQKIAEENVAQLKDLKVQLRSAIDEVSDNITDGPGRVKVARLFGEVAEYAQMDSWYRVAVMLDSSASEEYLKARSGEGLPTKPLVSFDEPKKEQPADDEESKNGDSDKQDESSENKASGGDDSKSKDAEKKADAKKVSDKEEAATKEESMKEGAEASTESEAAKPDAKKADAKKPAAKEPAAEETAAEVTGKKAEQAKKSAPPESSDKQNQN